MANLTDGPESFYRAVYDAQPREYGLTLRESAWENFASTGLPGRRFESWRYTDIKTALAQPAPLARPTTASGAFPKAHDAARLIVIDGVFRPDLSDLAELPSGVEALSLRALLAAEDASALAASGLGGNDPLVALNAALMQDGAVLRIAPGVRVARPIEIATLSTGDAPQSVFTRSLILCGAESDATIIENTADRAATHDNQALVTALAAGARLNLFSHVDAQNPRSVLVQTLLATLDEGARIEAFALLEGAGLTRRQIFARLSGARAGVVFNGAMLARDGAHVDTTLVVEHTAPAGESRERFRSILDAGGSGVFQGKIIVRPEAQKTDGVMQSKALLLSDRASMSNKPELEIYADDVKCGHGATSGQLDRDQLFYLMTRGLPPAEAETLLVSAFALEALDGLTFDAPVEFVAARVSAWIAGRAAE